MFNSRIQSDAVPFPTKASRDVNVCGAHCTQGQVSTPLSMNNCGACRHSNGEDHSAPEVL